MKRTVFLAGGPGTNHFSVTSSAKTKFLEFPSLSALSIFKTVWLLRAVGPIKGFHSGHTPWFGRTNIILDWLPPNLEPLSISCMNPEM